MTLLAKYFLSPQSSVVQAIEIIDRGAAQIALVVDEQNRLIGTVTDGDIRRALLHGKSLMDSIKDVMHKDFISVGEKIDQGEVLGLMRRNGLYRIPVLDQEGKVTRLVMLEDFVKFQNLPNQVLVMAGGEGRRLGDLTKNCPKPMLKVAGKPLLEIILLQCIDAGFRDFYFAVNYLKNHIKDYFQDGSRWNISIKYLEEERSLGTAGALSLLPQRPIHPFLVLNGDVLTRVNYRRLLNFHEEHRASATLCVREHSTQIPYGVVRINELNVLSMEEKPILTNYINSGIYMLDPDILDLVPNDSSVDMPHILNLAIKEARKVRAFPLHEYWLDIGIPETLERANGEWF